MVKFTTQGVTFTFLVPVGYVSKCDLLILEVYLPKIVQRFQLWLIIKRPREKNAENHL